MSVDPKRPPLDAVIVVPRGVLRQWQVDAIERAERLGAIRVVAIVRTRAAHSRLAAGTIGLLSAVERVIDAASTTLPAVGARRRALVRADIRWREAALISADSRGPDARTTRRWPIAVNLTTEDLDPRAIGADAVVECRLGHSRDLDDVLATRARGDATVRVAGWITRAGQTHRISMTVASVWERTRVVASLEVLLARAAIVLTRTLVCAWRRDRNPANGLRSIDRRLPVATASRLLLDSVAEYAQTTTHRLLTGKPTWFLAYRDRPEAFVSRTLASTGEGVRLIMPPPGRFFADPCVYTHDDGVYVFFEDFSYATGRGAISWMRRLPSGEFTAPELALERPYHLSYPFVFAHEGRVLMIPETAEAGCIELYVAEAFPRRWRRLSVLVDDIHAVDATLVRHDGRWWMFAAVGEEASSSSEELFVFHADSPFGPWRPHAANPVKSDVRSSRPAGGFFRRQHRLIRPAQNCARLYGGSIALCEVQELTTRRYRERVITELPPTWLPGNTRFHTISQSGSVEFFDGNLPVGFRRPVAATACSL